LTDPDSKQIMRLIILSTVLTLLGSHLVESARPPLIDSQPPIVAVKEIEPIKVELAEAKPIAESANIKAPEPVPVSTGGDVQSIIIAAANKYGVDVQRALRIAKCESGFNPQAVNHGYNENGYPSGLYQHLSGYYPARAAKYGYSPNVFDAYSNANVTMAMMKDGLGYMWECN
jgi:soluble lytic murein transglycosylase-like protein